MDFRKKEDGIFVLPLPGLNLLYAPLQESAFLVNDAALDALRSPFPKSPLPEIMEIRRLISSPPRDVPSVKRGPFVPDYLGLLPTRSCNLACRYCGFRAGRNNPSFMTPELAIRAIDWYAQLLSRHGRRELRVHFFGGEPMIAPGLVMMAVQAARVRASDFRMKAGFEISTNGVMSRASARFLADYIDSVVLSLDGPADIQNAHRPRRQGKESFPAVCRTARVLAERPEGLILRCCVSAASVGKMVEIAAWFAKEFRPPRVCFETLQPSPESKTSGLYPPDPWEFALGFVRAESLLERVGIEAVYPSADIGMIRLSFCLLGRDAAIVSPDGRISGCYLLEKDWRVKGLDLTLGKIDGSGVVSPDDEAVERLRNLADIRLFRCRDCFCRWHCAGGCRVNNVPPSPGQAYNDFCLQTRIITLYRLLKRLGREDVFESLIRQPCILREVILRESDRMDLQRSKNA